MLLAQSEQGIWLTDASQSGPNNPNAGETLVVATGFLTSNINNPLVQSTEVSPLQLTCRRVCLAGLLVWSSYLCVVPVVGRARVVRRLTATSTARMWRQHRATSVHTA
jgi:hypothetical protein